MISDDQDAARRLTETLLQPAPRHIALLGARADLIISHDRAAGFRQALKDFRGEVIVEHAEVFSRECGRRLMEQLLERLGYLPDALVTTAYVLLEGVFDVFQARADGWPEGLRVATFGDTQLLDFVPLKVNSIYQQHALIAANALELALRAVEENDYRPGLHAVPGNSSCATEPAAMRLVDTHNHLDFPDFDADRAALLQRSRALGVERQVVLGVYRENWQRVWDLAQAEDGLYAALGLHPVYLARHRPQHLDDLRQWLQRLRGETKLCAVGEIGLDYYLEHLDRDAQQALFEAQLRLAAEFRLPALIHVRRAHAATIATLKRIRLERRGIIHAFAGSREEAREYLKLGFRLGLGGAPTWPQANRLRKVAAEPAGRGHRAGNRCAGHGAIDASRPAQQSGAPAGHLPRPRRAARGRRRGTGGEQQPQRRRAVRLGLIKRRAGLPAPVAGTSRATPPGRPKAAPLPPAGAGRSRSSLADAIAGASAPGR